MSKAYVAALEDRVAWLERVLENREGDVSEERGPDENDSSTSEIQSMPLAEKSAQEPVECLKVCNRALLLATRKIRVTHSFNVVGIKPESSLQDTFRLIMLQEKLGNTDRLLFSSICTQRMLRQPALSSLGLPLTLILLPH